MARTPKLVVAGSTAALILAGVTGAEASPASLPVPDIFVVNLDGSREVDVSNDGERDTGPAWSPDGSKIAFSGGFLDILVVDADGTDQVRLTLGDDSRDYGPAWSPDGTRIAFASSSFSDLYAQRDIFVMRADGSDPTNLTNSAADDQAPTWSPDGSRIAFSSGTPGHGAPDVYDIFVMNADGSGQTRLTTDPGPDVEPDWSPDGRRIAFGSLRGGNDDVFVMNADGSGETNLTNDPRYENEPAWSPDGSRIAFTRNPNQPGGEGNYDIFVMNADGSGQIDLVSNPYYDEEPAWSPDGSRIAFSRSDDSFYRGGPPPRFCRVPRLMGLRLAAAQAKVRAGGCLTGRTRRAFSPRVGRVIGQIPKPGRLMPRATRVTLLVGS